MKGTLGIISLVLFTPLWVTDTYDHWGTDNSTRIAFLLATMWTFVLGLSWTIEYLAERKR